MTRSAALSAAVLALCGLASTVEASFNAAELVYLPVVSHAAGENGAKWRSDVTITNLDAAEVDVDVAVVYLPSGLISNAARLRDRTGMLGGRQSDGFGHVNEALAAIPPGGSVMLEDIVDEYWPDVASTGGGGALIVFGYEAESLEPDGSRVPRNIVVNSRTYNETTVLVEDPDNEGEYDEVPASYGQTIPGVPWYNLADASVVNDDINLSYQLIIGGAENDDYRFNVGLLNGSDAQTRISLRLQPYQPTGEPFPNATGGELAATVTLPPLAHVQYNDALYTLFGLEGDFTDITIKVTIIAWETASVAPIVGMTSYGSLVDNSSNDPTTLLPTFAFPYDVDCMWTVDTGGDGGKRRAGGPPVEMPSL